jgi:hypothetical protein
LTFRWRCSALQVGLRHARRGLGSCHVRPQNSIKVCEGVKAQDWERNNSRMYLEWFKRPAVMNRGDERFGAKAWWWKQETSNDVEVNELSAKKFSRSDRRLSWDNRVEASVE